MLVKTIFTTAHSEITYQKNFKAAYGRLLCTSKLPLNGGEPGAIGIAKSHLFYERLASKVQHGIDELRTITALGAMTLEVYYRFVRAQQGVGL